MTVDSTPAVAVLHYGRRGAYAVSHGGRWPVLGITGLFVALGLFLFNGLSAAWVASAAWHRLQFSPRPPLSRPLSAAEASAAIGGSPAVGSLNSPQAAAMVTRLQRLGPPYLPRPTSAGGLWVENTSDGSVLITWNDDDHFATLKIDAVGHVVFGQVMTGDVDGTALTETDAAGITTARLFGWCRCGAWTRRAAGTVLFASATFNIALAVALVSVAVQLLRRQPHSFRRARRWAQLDLIAVGLYVVALLGVVVAFGPARPVSAREVAWVAVVAPVACVYPLAVLAVARRRPGL